MVYDPAISDKISLSKVLDAFLLIDEKPSVIISFLQQHDDDFKDIIKHSFSYIKMLQLDFFLKCSSSEQDYLLSKLHNEVPLNDAAYLTWQIMDNNSNMTQLMKSRFKPILNQLAVKSVKHPYANRHEIYVGSYDNACFELIKTNSVLALAQLSDDKLFRFFKYLSYSLFIGRILQYDFFLQLKPLAKHTLLTETYKLTDFTGAAREFAFQLLDSNEDVEVKKRLVELLAPNLTSYDFLNHEELNLLNECSSFEEFKLKAMVYWPELPANTMLHLLFFKPRWFREWVEYDKDEVDSYVKVSCLAEYVTQRKKKRAA